MKRRILVNISFLVLVVSMFAGFSATRLILSGQEKIKVWICTGSGAYAYHNNRACSGLNNCKATIKQVTLKEAVEKYGRKPCQRCYKK